MYLEKTFEKTMFVVYFALDFDSICSLPFLRAMMQKYEEEKEEEKKKKKKKTKKMKAKERPMILQGANR